MIKIDKDFYENGQVLFIGYSGGKNRPFSKMVYQAFTNNGIKVYALNNKAEGDYDIKVYGSLGELAEVPTTAYVLLKKENVPGILKELGARGIKRIQFQSSRSADASVLEACAQKGIETAVACPLMKFGSGLHRLHGFFAGVR
ncbi:hypothetical protein CLHUN_05000 [Ruminiclostridium hungatei]|uniref:CoA-binding domain-containing protein n=1 Tax=Ruminiclostridium hungatei TaxID=48256 RepID=A0A1V4SRF3_RUMHU|nr:CoA-binding protein [Ruminiclostridium hungatei]OPX46025.1 hypothetical protein CLHUN_05000 [Ruminiclostridium hungatei]